jgi:antitoxin VapB
MRAIQPYGSLKIGWIVYRISGTILPMSLNIKSQRAVALVRELAVRTGTSQTAAVEDAVARRLAELDRVESTHAEARRAAAERILRELGNLLTDEDKRSIRQNEAELYDDAGLPR